MNKTLLTLTVMASLYKFSLSVRSASLIMLAPRSGLEGFELAPSTPSLSVGIDAGVGAAFTGVGVFFGGGAGVAFPPLASGLPDWNKLIHKKIKNGTDLNKIYRFS